MDRIVVIGSAYLQLRNAYSFGTERVDGEEEFRKRQSGDRQYGHRPHAEQVTQAPQPIPKLVDRPGRG